MDCFELDNIVVGGDELFFIMGPCVIESEEQIMRSAEEISNIRKKTGAQIIFKSSFDKANRTSIDSYRGPGLEEGLKILEKAGNSFDLPLITDVHLPKQSEPAAEVVDVLQIPAFLCRQTDHLVSAAKTGVPVNVKKGQFMDPENMTSILDKARSVGNDRLMVTERGTVFGYNNWVVDMRNLQIMRQSGGAVIYDATHSIQLPGAKGDASGGEREFIAPQARAAVATGLDGIFLETHPNPDDALCDGPNQLPLKKALDLVQQLQEIHNLTGEYRSDPLIPGGYSRE
ncbi:MAG: 3-deoxy-8-phosphooctulonate synthase [bacterium]